VKEGNECTQKNFKNIKFCGIENLERREFQNKQERPQSPADRKNWDPERGLDL
jgi:hypothetical protein